MRLLTLSFFLVFAGNAFSQAVNISLEDRSKYLTYHQRWSLREQTGYKDDENVIQLDITGPGYGLRSNSQLHTITIRKFDKSGKEIAVHKAEGGEKLFGPVRSKSVSFNERILLFYLKFSVKDSMNLYMSEVDRETLQLVNSTCVFSFVQKNLSSTAQSNDLPRQISLQVSPDKSKLLLMVAGKKGHYFSCVIDKGLRVIRKKTSVIPATDAFIISNAYVDNAGNSIAAISESFGSAATFEYSNSKFILMQRTDNSEKVTNVASLGLPSEIHNMAFKGSIDNSQVFIAGEYPGEIGMGGIVITTAQLNNFQIDNIKSLPYPGEFAKRVYDIGYGMRKRKEFGIERSHFELVDFGNGELAICGTPMLRIARTNSTTSYAGPIIAAFLSSKKEPVFTMIPRSQIYCEGSYPAYLPYNDKLVVIYNDYAKNINGPLLLNDVHQAAGTMVQKLSLAYAVVTRDGNIESRKILSDGISRTNFFDTSETEMINNNKIEIPSASPDSKSDQQKVAVITIQ